MQQVLLYGSRLFDGSSAERLSSAARDAARKLSIPTDDFAVCRTEMGKPYFSHAKGLFFSVTHSGSYWMAAFSNDAVGLDLQMEKSCDALRIAKRFFHPSEEQFLRAARPPVFFDLWALKESVVKLKGTGVIRDFSQFSVAEGAILNETKEGIALQLLPSFPGYHLAIAAKKRIQTEPCWMINKRIYKSDER